MRERQTEKGGTRAGKEENCCRGGREGEGCENKSRKRDC